LLLISILLFFESTRFRHGLLNLLTLSFLSPTPRQIVADYVSNLFRVVLQFFSFSLSSDCDSIAFTYNFFSPLDSPLLTRLVIREFVFPRSVSPQLV